MRTAIKKVKAKQPLGVTKQGVANDPRKKKCSRTPHTSTTSPKLTKKALLYRKAVRLRAQGYTYKQIGQMLGTHDSHVYMMVREFLDRTFSVKGSEQMAKEILIKSEMMVEANMPIALRGGERGAAAATVILRSFEGIRKLFGLDKKEVKEVQHTGSIAFLAAEDDKL